MASEYIKNKRKLKGIRIMLFAIAVINVLISVVLGVVSSFLTNPIPTYLQSLIIGLCAYIIPIFIYAKSTGITAESAEKNFYLKKTKLKHLGISLVLGVCWQFVMIVISLPVSLWFGGTVDAAPTSLTELCAALFVIGVIPAIFEEFLFRGIVDGSMSEFNTGAAVTFSSLMFALMHADIYNFLGYIAMGVILTIIVRRTGSVYNAVTFHFASNVTALLLSFFNAELFYVPVFTIGIFIAGIIGFAVIYAAFLSVTEKAEKVSIMKKNILLGQSFVNVPILLCLALLISAMILSVL